MAEAGADEAEDRVHLAALHREGGLEPLGPAGGDGQFPQVVAVPEHHEPLARQVRDAHRMVSAGGGHVPAGDHDQVLAEQFGGEQRGGGGGQRQHHQRQVEGAACQLADQVVRAVLLDHQPDARITVVVRAQHVRQEPGAQARRGAEADPAAAQLDQLLHLVAGGVGVREDAPGQRQERLTGVGQGDVPPRAQEEVGAQLPLQGPDLLGEGGLRHVHHLGGPGEVAGLGDGHEVVELLELHTGTLHPNSLRLWK